MTRGDFARIPELRMQIARAQMLWENALSSATNITSVITGMPHAKGVFNKIESSVIKADEYYERYNALCDELKDIWLRLRRDIVIYKLNQDETMVINMYYPQRRKIGDIAKEMGKTERHIYRIKKTAIRKVCGEELTHREE